jgi:hypothetical protein
MLPQRLIVADLLQGNATNDLLGLRDELVELLIGPNVQVSEALEELRQVFYGTIPEHFRLAFLAAGKPLGEMRDEFCYFWHKIMIASAAISLFLAMAVPQEVEAHRRCYHGRAYYGFYGPSYVYRPVYPRYYSYRPYYARPYYAGPYHLYGW